MSDLFFLANSHRGLPVEAAFFLLLRVIEMHVIFGLMAKIAGWDDTIVALATPPGVGAIGVIRLSGKKAWEIADNLFPSKSLQQQASHTLHVGYLQQGEKVLDEVVVSLFKGPRSYTG